MTTTNAPEVDLDAFIRGLESEICHLLLEHADLDVVGHLLEVLRKKKAEQQRELDEIMEWATLRKKSSELLRHATEQ